jgi:outer membrane protein
MNMQQTAVTSFIVMCFVTVASPAHAQPTYSLVDAVEETLTQHAGIKIQEQQVGIGRGALLQAAGTFDPILGGILNQNRASLPLTSAQKASLGTSFSEQQTNQLNISSGVSRQFRNGISISPVFSLAHNSGNLIPRVNSRSSMGFTVTLPLLAGRGRSVVGAQETQAKLEVDAALLDLNQTIAQQVTTTVLDYWNAVAAKKNLQIAQESEARGDELVRNLQLLVEADRSPKNDLNTVKANLSSRRATRINAEQQAIQARSQLALDMGREPATADDLPEATEDFPSHGIPGSVQFPAVAAERYIDSALKNRADILAAKARTDETKAGIAPARNLLLPGLDLSLTSSYSGLQEGTGLDQYLSTLFLGGYKPNFAGSLTYTFSPANNIARGKVMQAEAALRQSKLKEKDLERSAQASVVVAIEAIQNGVANSASARESVEFYQAALEGEREKLRLGRGSIIDILTVEDRLTVALAQLVQAQLRYSQAIIQLRFASGTLVSPNEPVQSITNETLETLPFAPVSDQAPDAASDQTRKSKSN